MINKGGWRVGGPRGGYFAPYENPNLQSGPNGESLPLRLGRETAEFIEANRDKPFLAYLSFYSVHSPIQTTRALWQKYRDKAAAAGLVEERFIFDRRLAVRQVQDCPIYAGMIEAMDEAIGIVLRKLDEHGLTDNTIICFTSDNGGVSTGDGGLGQLGAVSLLLVPSCTQPSTMLPMESGGSFSINLRPIPVALSLVALPTKSLY